LQPRYVLQNIMILLALLWLLQYLRQNAKPQILMIFLVNIRLTHALILLG
jgi:hypothetical protein